MKRKVKICDFIHRARKLDDKTTSEEKLWRAVLCQVAEDAFITSKKKSKVNSKNEAIYWLIYNEKALEKICIYAGIRYNMVKKLRDKFIKRKF